MGSRHSLFSLPQSATLRRLTSSWDVGVSAGFEWGLCVQLSLCSEKAYLAGEVDCTEWSNMDTEHGVIAGFWIPVNRWGQVGPVFVDWKRMWQVGSFKRHHYGWTVEPQLGIKKQAGTSMCKCQVNASCGPMKSQYSRKASSSFFFVSGCSGEPQLNSSKRNNSALPVPQLKPS